MHLATKNKIKNFGITRFCTVCRSFLNKFEAFGLNPRSNALCPVCGSLERHRLIWMYFKNKTNLFTENMRMLHAAPENCFVRRLKEKENIDYVCIDANSPLAGFQMDITNLDFSSHSFDIFYCSDVLEHVPEDSKAISEIYRILKPGGLAIILVPISGKVTQEDLSIQDPEVRRNLYGDPDHVRMYGFDFKDKLQKSGFQVNVVDYLSEFNFLEKTFLGLTTRPIFHCIKK